MNLRHWTRPLGLAVVGLPLLLGAGPKVERVVIDANFPEGYQVEVADVNGDGKPDLVAVGGATCAWYENPTWTKRVVSGPDTTADIISSATLDLDGDGWAEMAIGHDFAMNSPKRGKLSLASHRPDGTWKVEPVTDLSSIHRLRWADVDGDRTPELVVAPIFGPASQPPALDQDPARTVVFRVGTRPREVSTWTREEVGGDRVQHAIRTFDLDGQGRDSVLAAGASGVTRFDRAPKTGQWTPRNLTSGAPGPNRQGSSEIQVGRFADGGRFLATIDPWHGSEVAIARSLGLIRFGMRRVIDTTLSDGHALWVADVDGDGDDEVFAGYRGGSGGVNLYKHDPSTWKWTRTVIDPTVTAQDLRGGDLDGDGRLDVVAIGGRSHNLVWYRFPVGP